MTHSVRLLPIVIAGMLIGCSDRAQPLAPLVETASLAASQAVVVDIGGTWNYAETVVLVVKPGDEVIHITCTNPDGVLTIDQNGATFTGTLTHPTSICETKDGQIVPAPWPMPYQAVLSGRISGRSLHIDQVDAPPAPPVPCVKQGVIRVSDGAAISLQTTGRCDLSGAPFRPATARNSATATRL